MTTDTSHTFTFSYRSEKYSATVSGTEIDVVPDATDPFLYATKAVMEARLRRGEIEPGAVKSEWSRLRQANRGSGVRDALSAHDAATTAALLSDPSELHIAAAHSLNPRALDGVDDALLAAHPNRDIRLIVVRRSPVVSLIRQAALPELPDFPANLGISGALAFVRTHGDYWFARAADENPHDTERHARTQAFAEWRAELRDLLASAGGARQRVFAHLGDDAGKPGFRYAPPLDLRTYPPVTFHAASGGPNKTGLRAVLADARACWQAASGLPGSTVEVHVGESLVGRSVCHGPGWWTLDIGEECVLAPLAFCDHVDVARRLVDAVADHIARGGGGDITLTVAEGPALNPDLNVVDFNSFAVLRVLAGTESRLVHLAATTTRGDGRAATHLGELEIEPDARPRALRRSDDEPRVTYTALQIEALSAPMWRQDTLCSRDWRSMAAPADERRFARDDAKDRPWHSMSPATHLVCQTCTSELRVLAARNGSSDPTSVPQ
ncbi:MAG TPA: hypothetical protein VHD87_14950 [Acidimicrobiales bacterium]|nr:hypothetical protein [Acidimicrobiales bacterium]